eukprot:TRINITY_DN10737_c0_g2_i5.p2 TRINITY_DN10737_c0_g2~~TRINITY_DN10737_c0_g2_i5.p2  ORF type:complete len:301 (+),score=72.67 TRINITY_DN10737_c0_g2_i5:398-1300(+)
MSEIRLHRSLRHPSIVRFKNFFEDAENVYIILELCSNQTVNELVKRRKRLTELEVQHYTVHIIDGLRYLHSKRIVHRDLKLSNLFLNGNMEEKIGDFGLATKLEINGDRKRTLCGTPNYIAPEIINESQGHSFEVDIWSLGVSMYAMLFGVLPFEAADVNSTYKRIKTNSYSFPENIPASSPAKDLISQIFNLDPAKRPTLDKILEHPFMHMIENLPRTMPASTLARPPEPVFVKQSFRNLDEYLDHAIYKIKELNERVKTESKKEEGIKDCSGKDRGVWIKKWVDYSDKYGMGTAKHDP